MHFSVLVVTDQKPTKEVLNAALRPFDGDPADEFLEDLDVTDTAHEEYAVASGAKLLSPDGELHDRFEERFYREPTPEEDKFISDTRRFSGAVSGTSFKLKTWSDGFLSVRVRFVPDGWREVPNTEPYNQTLSEFCQEYFGIPEAFNWEALDLAGEHRNGYVLVDADGNVHKVVQRQSNNGHWDWWEIGGRFNGMMANGGNKCRRSEMDAEAMLAKDESLRRAAISTLAQKAGIGDEGVLELLHVFREAVTDWTLNGKGSWDEYHLFLSAFDKRLGEFGEDLRALPLIHAGHGLEDYYRDGCPFVCYAIVKDGTWLEEERVPFWRMKAGTLRSDWEKQCWNTFKELPGDKWLTMVDCHN